MPSAHKSPSLFAWLVALALALISGALALIVWNAQQRIDYLNENLSLIETEQHTLRATLGAERIVSAEQTRQLRELRKIIREERSGPPLPAGTKGLQTRRLLLSPLSEENKSTSAALLVWKPSSGAACLYAPALPGENYRLRFADAANQTLATVSLTTGAPDGFPAPNAPFDAFSFSLPSPQLTDAVAAANLILEKELPGKPALTPVRHWD